MARPIVSQAAEDLYEILQPLAYADEANDWPLLVFCEAWVGPLDLVQRLSEDNWTNILDIDKTPDEALEWLAQLVGASPLPKGVPWPSSNYYEVLRNYLRENPEFRTGSPQGIIAAARQTLTRQKQVTLRERDGSPYKLSIYTRTIETPDPTRTFRAIMAQKPAGIILTYSTKAGAQYSDLLFDHTNYAGVLSTYLTYQGVINHEPGT
jgi:hypothetical protein